jgi:GNAT superfamily N-acetyltransferase
MTVMIRPARPEDAAVILDLIRGLARYERLEHAVAADEALVAKAPFGDAPRVFCDLAENDGHVAGFAFWFYMFSTFVGHHGIYLEDLYVRPEHRGRGIGRALLGGLARRCAAEGLGCLEWSVLDWNQPAIQFYRAQGGSWTTGPFAGSSAMHSGPWVRPNRPSRPARQQEARLEGD